MRIKGMGSYAETLSLERSREHGSARLIMRIGVTSIGESTFTRRRVSSNLTKVKWAAATFLFPTRRESVVISLLVRQYRYIILLCIICTNPKNHNVTSFRSNSSRPTHWNGSFFLRYRDCMPPACTDAWYTPKIHIYDV